MLSLGTRDRAGLSATILAHSGTSPAGEGHSPLGQHLQRRRPGRPPPHHPRRIEGGEKAPGHAGAQRPEGLQRQRQREMELELHGRSGRLGGGWELPGLAGDESGERRQDAQGEDGWLSPPQLVWLCLGRSWAVPLP